MIVRRLTLRLISGGLLIGCAAFTPRAAPAQEVLGGIPDTSADSTRVRVTSGTLIPGDLLRDLPVDDPRQALALTPGVVMRGGEKTLDLRLGKGFHSRGIDLKLHADLRNLLNFRNTLALFAETGTTTNDSCRRRVEGSELASLASEAQANNALLPDGSVDVRACAGWTGYAGPVNCVVLERVEARFGDGDRIYSPAEQQKALDTYYTSFLGAWRFFGPGRTARLGMELRF